MTNLTNPNAQSDALDILGYCLVVELMEIEKMSNIEINYDNALNEAGWALIEEMRKFGEVNGNQFNHIKPSLKIAIEKYLNSSPSHATDNPKPRTKTEFVKVEFASDKEKAEAFIEGGLRYFTHCPVTGDKEKDTIPVTRLDELLCGNGIYRKVETEIDERQEFIDTAVELLNRDDHGGEASYYEGWFESMFDSGKFKLVE